MLQISDFDISSKDPYLIQLMIQILQNIQYKDEDVRNVSAALLALFMWVKQVVQAQSVAIEEKITLLEVRERIL